MNSSKEIPKALAEYIATRDRAEQREKYFTAGPELMHKFQALLRGETITVGGRTTCGSYTDPTWKTYIRWNEIVRKAQKCGFIIESAYVKHGNGWATKAGGFWEEQTYRLVPDAQ